MVMIDQDQNATGQQKIAMAREPTLQSSNVEKSMYNRQYLGS
jgi:hypothetical protein